MTAPVLILAQATATDGSFMQTLHKIADQFGVRWPFLIAQIVNFLVIAALLWYFAFKPVLATIGDRQKKIEDGLKYADEMKAKLAAAQQAYDAQIHDAQIKAREIIAETQKTSKELADKQLKETVERANGLIEKAQMAIELEKKKMLAEARTEIARLVVATTQQVLGRELSDADRSRYNEAAARELTQV
jgi:F-type H+-transporting ATPase subunit b